MNVVHAVDELRLHVGRARGEGQSIGLVPTMGKLHEGHASLIERARAETDFVVVSIFVNPTQFSPEEDFERYPRDLGSDTATCKREGVDVVFAPTVDEMYPTGFKTYVTVEELSDALCGTSRPGHFRGVATVVAKLFNQVQPNKAFFGQKDGQQAVILRRMVQDLDMPLEIVVCPTVREEDGVAMSSRNSYLTKEERRQATALFRALSAARRAFEGGQREADKLLAEMKRILTREPLIRVDYAGIVDSETLEPVQWIDRCAFVAVAAYVGRTRLIDNIILQ